MENDIDSKPIKEPSGWDKFLAGAGGGSLAAIVTQAPLMVVELFSIASRRISKRPLGAEDIAFHNKLNDMMHSISLPATLVGAAIGWDAPEREYLKGQNSSLQTENAELKGRLYINSHPKSWVESEQVKTEAATKVEHNR